MQHDRSHRATLAGDGHPGPVEERIGRRLVRLLDPLSDEARALGDAGRIEWIGPEGSPLGRVPAERLGEVRIRLRPSVRLVSSPHPILAIWEANQEGRDGTPAHAQGERVVVRRNAALEVVPAGAGPS